MGALQHVDLQGAQMVLELSMHEISIKATDGVPAEVGCVLAAAARSYGGSW